MAGNSSPPPAADAIGAALFAASLQGVLVVRAGAVLAANDAAAALFGAPQPEGLIDRGLEALLSPQAAQALHAAPQVGPGVQPLRLEVRGAALDGSPRDLEVAGLNVSWEQRPALLLTVLDRTARGTRPAVAASAEAGLAKADLSEAKESTGQYRQIIDGSLQGIYVHAEHRFLFVNPSFARIFGYDDPRAVLAVGNVMDLYAPEEHARMLGYYRERVSGGSPPMRYEFQGVRRNGERIWLENLVRVVTWEGRQAVLATVVEITERKRAEQQLLASEEKYRNTVEGSVQGILVHRSGKPMFANQAFAMLFGFASPEAVCALDSVDILIADEDRERMLAYARSRLRGEPVPARYVYRGRRRDGRLIWLENLVRLVNWDGEPALQVAVVDVTERVDAEQRLRESERLMRAVLDLIPMWVFVKDAQRRFLMVNRAMAQDYGLENPIEPGALLDLGASLSAEERDAVYALDARVLQGAGAVEEPELSITLPRGETRVFRSVRMPLRDSAGAITGIVGIMEDITERRRDEQSLLQAQKLESLGVLAGGIAHDFNNLLVTILGNSALALLDLLPDSPARRPLEQVERAGQRAADLCRQLLAYAGQGSFELAAISLNELIEDMTELLRVSLSKGIEMAYRFDPRLPAVEVDPTQLRQVVMNLIMNAAEAIGDSAGRITVSTALLQPTREELAEYIQGGLLPEGEYLLLEVADTGLGIDPEILRRIFDPFFTTKFTGRGLGLAAVLGIVRGHRGALRVLTTPDQGTIFRLLIPVKAPAAEATPAL